MNFFYDHVTTVSQGVILPLLLLDLNNVLLTIVVQALTGMTFVCVAVSSYDLIQGELFFQ